MKKVLASLLMFIFPSVVFGQSVENSNLHKSVSPNAFVIDIGDLRDHYEETKEKYKNIVAAKKILIDDMSMRRGKLAIDRMLLSKCNRRFLEGKLPERDTGFFANVLDVEKPLLKKLKKEAEEELLQEMQSADCDKNVAVPSGASSFYTSKDMLDNQWKKTVAFMKMVKLPSSLSDNERKLWADLQDLNVDLALTGIGVADFVQSVERRGQEELNEFFKKNNELAEKMRIQYVESEKKRKQEEAGREKYQAEHRDEILKERQKAISEMSKYMSDMYSGYDNMGDALEAQMQKGQNELQQAIQSGMIPADKAQEVMRMMEQAQNQMQQTKGSETNLYDPKYLQALQANMQGMAENSEKYANMNDVPYMKKRLEELYSKYGHVSEGALTPEVLQGRAEMQEIAVRLETFGEKKFLSDFKNK